MGTYKVIQDIEAEDKLLGPLSLRQFIYAVIVVVLGFIAFKLTLVNPLLALPFLPPMILFGVLASPFSKDQPSEVWLLAKIRFFLKPKRRIWDQTGMKELVTITAPKRIEKILSDNLSQTEVRSRLEALANTIDSRGWAIKNVNVNMFSQPSYVLDQVSSDRLIDPTTMSQEVSDFDIGNSEDILDAANDRAQVLDQMMATSTTAHKQQVAQIVNTPAQAPAATNPPTDYWFLNQSPAPQAPDAATFNKPSLVQPGQTNTSTTTQATSGVDEKALLQKIHNEKAKPSLETAHLNTLKPMAHEPKPTTADTTTKNPAPSPVIASLASDNNRSVATIAKEANNNKPPEDEVVISLR